MCVVHTRKPTQTQKPDNPTPAWGIISSVTLDCVGRGGLWSLGGRWHWADVLSRLSCCWLTYLLVRVIVAINVGKSFPSQPWAVGL